MTRRNIMAAVLQSAGKVVKHKMLVSNWKFLNMLTSKQFVTAASDLQEIGLGSLITLPTSSRPSQVFIKKLPQEVAPVLEENPDLCTVEYYAVRFNLPTSKYVTQQMREKLVSMGLVPYEWFATELQM